MSIGTPVDSSKSEVLSYRSNKKDRCAPAELTGVPVNAVEYHGHGQDAHATIMPLLLEIAICLLYHAAESFSSHPPMENQWHGRLAHVFLIRRNMGETPMPPDSKD